ncbi:hypothetical protein B1759_03275 [Rubrivirga sp. SAORIC476]|uniref:DUF302 domain-containing protein n=1 Tax=Rubrivirga sp. SAORIC476 TaxID=1961794 RepID=UPI000BA92EC2|nr:DUF302 domain-containing protein [Rubrivirga sp. SAORIC476]PAP80426.1 hypothetical protein B1759_03275 [Rubrivirga sp. SAORIC476]
MADYTFSRTLDADLATAEARTRAALSDEGFGVLTEIDIQATMKAKLDADVTGYTILGACNPPLAFQAMQAEPRIGAMLPCNVILRDVGDGQTEVSAIDPVASMAAIDNADLGTVATEVRERLQRVVAAL